MTTSSIKKKRYRFIEVLFAIGWLMASTAAVAEIKTINELFQSNVVYTQETDELEVTFRLAYLNGADSDHWLLPIGLEYGITDNLQVEIEWTVYARDNPDIDTSADGVGDFSIGLQHSWLNIGDKPLHAAIALELVFDTGDDDLELNEEGTAWEPFLVVATKPAFLMGIEAFVEIGGEISSEENEKYFNLGGYYRAFGNQLLSLEYNHEEEARYLTPGLMKRWQNGWEAGMGIPVGLNDDSDNFRVIFILIYEG
jgi:hypothetical protein